LVKILFFSYTNYFLNTNTEKAMLSTRICSMFRPVDAAANRYAVPRCLQEAYQRSPLPAQLFDDLFAIPAPLSLVWRRLVAVVRGTNGPNIQNGHLRVLTAAIGAKVTDS
jgi:hypothetical protein